jgi:hypothetical protein
VPICMYARPEKEQAGSFAWPLWSRETSYGCRIVGSRLVVIILGGTQTELAASTDRLALAWSAARCFILGSDGVWGGHCGPWWIRSSSKGHL